MAETARIPRKDGSFCMNNATPNFLFIRPSSKPISAKGFEEMMNSGDAVQEKGEITKRYRFEFLSDNVAMCIFTLGSKFINKGTPNYDLPKVNSFFKNMGDVWKIHWMERSKGDSDLSLWV